MVVSFILAILLLAVMRMLRIRLFEPAGLYSVFWLIFISGSFIFLGKSYVFTYYGIVWILATCYAFVLVARIIKPSFIGKKILHVREPHIKWKLLILFIVLGVGSVVYNMLSVGADIGVFADFSSLQSVAHTSAVNRYSEGGSEGTSIFVQVLNSFIYISPLCAGYSLVYAKKKKEKYICYFSVVPPVLSMLLTSAKLSVVTFVIVFFVGYYVAYIYKNKSIPAIKIRMIFLGSIIGIILFFLFYLSFVLRIGKTNYNVAEIIISKLMIYAFGHVQGFDLWFKKYAFNLRKYGWGCNTFLAISSKLGISEKKQGVYGLIGGSCTNVYTQYRGLIEDFGPILSFIVLIIVFCIVQYLYVRIRVCRKPHVLLQVIFVTNLFWIFYFIVSAWVYTTYMISILVFGIFLYLSYYITIKKKNGSEQIL